MNKIVSSINCVNCKNVLTSPVLLPCTHTICKQHTIDVKGPILCCLCQKEHLIPPNTGFPHITLDFGDEYREANHSCHNLHDLLVEIDEILNDPSNFTIKAIANLKNIVQSKGDEIKLNIEKQMNHLISKLDEYSKDCQSSLSTNDYLNISKKMRAEKEEAEKNLQKWISSLNEIKFDEKEWTLIKTESENAIKRFQVELDNFKTDILLEKRFDQFIDEIEQVFGAFELNPMFDFK